MIGALALVAIIALVVILVASLAVGMLIDDGIGALGRTPRRSPGTSYWSIR